MSAIHRIDDVEAMPAPKFLRLAHRISCYQGVMAARLAESYAALAATLPPVESRAPQPEAKAVPVYAGGGSELVKLTHRALSIRR